MMKKFLLLILLATLLVACSDDDNDYENEIVGSWTLESVTPKINTNNDKVTQAIRDDIENSNDLVLEFTENGKVITYENNLKVDEGTYTLKGEKLTLKFPDGDSSTLTINIFGDALSYSIDLTDIYQEEIAEMLPNETNIVVSRVNISYMFKKK